MLTLDRIHAMGITSTGHSMELMASYHLKNQLFTQFIFFEDNNNIASNMILDIVNKINMIFGIKTVSQFL